MGVRLPLLWDSSRHELLVKVAEVAHQINSVRRILGPHKDLQAMWTVLQCSLSWKLDWQLSLNYPSDVEEAAKNLDSELRSLLEFSASQHIPRTDEGMGVECVLGDLDLPPFLQGRSYQSRLVRHPVRLCRLGLRSLLQTSHVAFCGSVEMAVPCLTGEGGICTVMEDVVGTVKGPARWQDFLQAGPRTSREFELLWRKPRSEMICVSPMLGKQRSGPLVEV